MDFLESASLILREAWQPPMVRYPVDSRRARPNWLAWQFQFPSSLPARAAAAFDGEEPVGFIALIPRMYRFRGVRLAGYLLSFVAVRPAWQGLRIASRLYTTLMATKGVRDVPIAAFSESGSIGESLLLKSMALAGCAIRSLGDYRLFSSLLPSEYEADGMSVEEMRDEDDYLAVIDQCDDDRFLWNDAGHEQLLHLGSDPRRPNALVLVRNPHGQAVAAGSIVRSESTSVPRGETLAQLEGLFVPKPSLGILRAIMQGVRFLDRESIGTGLITACNLKGLDASLLRSAGFRATHAGFNGYLFLSRPEHGFLGEASGTNLRIV